MHSSSDLTELPGLDDLSAPSGVIADIEQRAARMWGSAHSFVSVNGASAALTAAILAAASGPAAEAHSRKYALIPRNAHRSVINALCLASVEPIWYEPKFESDWGIWGAAGVTSLQAGLDNALENDLSVVFALVVSPTYGGALSNIRSLSRLTKARGIPLIVDEAHGAHFFPHCSAEQSAIACGADAVAHSWHKTLPALTQTGMLHLPEDSLINAASARSCLNLVSSSSPSYLLLASMEKTIALLESSAGKTATARLEALGGRFRAELKELPGVTVYDTESGINPSHILISADHEQTEGHSLYEFLQDRGIFAEAAMGTGVLFMLGLGSDAADIDLAIATIKDFVSAYELNEKGENFVASAKNPVGNAHAFAKRQPSFQPILPPHQAMSMPHETVAVGEALGRIAAQCLAPCPPGIPILIPGQKITEEVLELVSDKVLVVVAH